MFFEIFLFHFFIFSFVLFFQHKKDKKKKCTFVFRKPFFDTLTNCPKIIFAPLHTICVFLDQQKNTIKLGKTSKQKILDGFSTQKPPNLGRIFNSTAHMCMLPPEELETVPPFWGPFSHSKIVFLRNCVHILVPISVFMFSGFFLN